MNKEKPSFNLRNIIKTAIVTGFISSSFGFIYNIGLREMFLSKGELVYEIPIIAHFEENKNKFSVCNLTVKNIGNTVIENVTFSVRLKGDDRNIKCSFQQSSYHIRVKIEPTNIDTLENNIYTMLFLNETESVTFQFKVSRFIKSENLAIELRAKGYVGHQWEIDKKGIIKVYQALIFFILIFLFFILFFSFKQSEKRHVTSLKNKDSIKKIKEE